MAAARAVSFVVGVVVISVLLAVVPAPVFDVARAILLFAAALVLVAVAAALFVVPARVRLVRVFALPMQVRERGRFAMPPEEDLRTTLRPLVTGGILLAVVLAAMLVRGEMPHLR